MGNKGLTKLEKEKLIIENFANAFNKIKRINEGELSESNWREGPTNDSPFNEPEDIFDNLENRYVGVNFTPLGKLNIISQMNIGKTLLLKFSGDVPSAMKDIEIFITNEGQQGVNISASRFGDIDELMVTSDTAEKIETIYQEFVGKPSGIHYHREDDLSKYSMGMYLERQN